MEILELEKQPTSTLDVSGTTNISGELTVNSVGKFIGESTGANQNEVYDDPGVYIGALSGTYGNLQIVTSTTMEDGLILQNN